MEIEKFDDEDGEKQSCLEKVFWGFLYFLNFMKMVAMIGIVGYFWIWTSDNRLVDMDVLEQLCKHGILNITFHENRLFGRVNDATAKD